MAAIRALSYHSGKAITWNYYPEISYIPKNNDRFCHLRCYQKVKILGWAHGLLTGQNLVNYINNYFIASVNAIVANLTPALLIAFLVPRC